MEPKVYSNLTIVNKQDGPTKHVALVGMTKAGKNTLVIVLNGLILAPVTNDVKPRTARPEHCDIKEGVKYSPWDMKSLNEAQEQDTMGPISRLLKYLRGIPDVDRELRDFLRGKRPKIDFILFYIEAEKIRVPAHWKNYAKIYAKFCRKKNQGRGGGNSDGFEYQGHGLEEDMRWYDKGSW